MRKRARKTARTRPPTASELAKTSRQLDFADSPENTSHSTILKTWSKLYDKDGK